MDILEATILITPKGNIHKRPILPLEVYQLMIQKNLFMV